jgi:hypothetical protein
MIKSGFNLAAFAAAPAERRVVSRDVFCVAAGKVALWTISS